MNSEDENPLSFRLASDKHSPSSKNNMTNHIAVEFKNVSKDFDEVKAVRDLNFSIESGQLVTLLGPSGC